MYNLKSLKRITIESTSFCNARCPQCDRFDKFNKTIVPLKHLDCQWLEKNLNPGLLPALQEVVLEGNCGDVLSHRDPESFLRLYKDVEKIRIVTNGSIRNEKFFENLATYKNLEITFSVDGLQDTNSMYRQNTDFDKIMNNARAFIGNGGKAVWKFIVFKHNEHQIDQARNLSRTYNFAGFETQHSDRSWYHGKKWPVFNDGRYVFDLEPSEKFVDIDSFNNDQEKLSETITNYYKSRKISECPLALKKEIFIDYNGYVLPCCILSNDFWQQTYNTKFLKKYLPDPGVISIKQFNIEQIFDSEFYTKTLKESFSTKPMPKCLLYCSSEI